MAAYSKILKKINVYSVLFGLFAVGIALVLGFVSLLLMLDMLGLSLF
ncbi:MAG: hypothetical protein VCF07_19500 [Nitrospinota bacterium]